MKIFTFTLGSEKGGMSGNGGEFGLTTYNELTNPKKKRNGEFILNGMENISIYKGKYIPLDSWADAQGELLRRRIMDISQENTLIKTNSISNSDIGLVGRTPNFIIEIK
jgi:hypothetical protein